jgi:hypothetical protein
MRQLRCRYSLMRKAVYFAMIYNFLNLFSLRTYITDLELVEKPILINEYLYSILSENLAFVLVGAIAYLIIAISFSITNRFSSVLIWIMAIYIDGLFARVADGGNNINHIILFYFFLINESENSEIEVFLRKIFKCVVIFQISIMYMTAGLYKTLSPQWQNGTALFYVVTSAEYSTGFWRSLFGLCHPIFYVVPNYLIILYQLSFPLSLLNKRLKYAYLLFGACMHLSIAFIVGLPNFALYVIALYPIFLSEANLRDAYIFSEKVGHRIFKGIQDLSIT